jgi:prepilin-type N-terminal cleavage/methylation domain-containing protein
MRRTGVTLVELMVVLAILGAIAAVSGLALASLTPAPVSPRVLALRRARIEAIHGGVPVGLRADGTALPAVRFLPDGRAIGSEVDPLTGAPRDSAR